MTDGRPIIIAANEIERLMMRKAFGLVHPEAIFVCPGWVLAGFRASCIMVTPGVDRNSVWFKETALIRLLKGAGVFEVKFLPTVKLGA